MRDAATKLEFERAAHIRDQIAALKGDGSVMTSAAPAKGRGKTTYPKGNFAKKRTPKK